MDSSDRELVGRSHRCPRAARRVHHPLRVIAAGHAAVGDVREPLLGRMVRRGDPRRRARDRTTVSLNPRGDGQLSTASRSPSSMATGWSSTGSRATGPNSRTRDAELSNQDEATSAHVGAMPPTQSHVVSARHASRPLLVAEPRTERQEESDSRR